jgi:hypothetical protein
MQKNLTKSIFIRGLQCYKSLYLLKNSPELRQDASEMRQSIFDQGVEVGILARKLFPGGKDASTDQQKNPEKIIENTRRLIENGADIIYKAGFVYDDVHCFVDILEKKNGLWRAYEVKSANTVTELYLWDTALQYYVMTKSGLDLDVFSIIHLNSQYIRRGTLNLSKLFSIAPVTGLIFRMQEDIENALQGMKKVLAQNKVPKIEIGQHCFNPYECDFRKYCWSHVPEKSIFDISGLNPDKKWSLYQKGITEFKDIPKDYPLTPKQWQQVNSELTGETFINQGAVKDFINQLTYPLYFLDFESFQPPIPLFDQTRPFQQVVFQYSLHLIPAPGEMLEHKQFLAQPGKDPRIPFIRRLISDLGTEGTILVYNRAFEAGRLREIARDFPDYEEPIAYIVERIMDLMVPFQQRYVYLPEMQGSYSIKQVLPALVPMLNYKNLMISDGATASFAFASLFREKNPERISEIRKNLRDYCMMDTQAMVHILDALHNEVMEEE